jgi:hypothetical protein
MMASRGFWDSVVEIVDGNEADVETRIVLPLLQELGYELDCIASKVPVTFQEGREKRPGRKPEADFVVYAERPLSRATSLIVVEAKRPNEPLDDGKDQGESYAQNLRTPILLMTNGQMFEIWQMQLTTESEKVFDCSVAEFASKRAEIESLLSREALKAHCGSLVHKRFDLAANDLGAYLSAEIERIDPIARASIPRRLARTDTNSTISAIDLLTHYTRGALVLGMSGYGKTTLAKQLLHEALERRIEETSTILPFEIFLPDFANSQSSIAGFLVERIASHKPGFTGEALLRIARDFGVLLLADGFDRVPFGQRGVVETALRHWMRDYPKTQTIIMSRKQSAPTEFGVPALCLQGYEIGDLQDLADRRSAMGLPEAKYVFSSAPHYIQNVAHVPLLADLVIEIYSTTRQYPTNLNALYETWLNRILAGSSSVERALDRVFLEELAEQTTAGPVSIEDAVVIGRTYLDSRQALERLSDADAISVRGTTVELQHEGLADFLRAKKFWKQGDGYAQADLSYLLTDASSQLPILLLSTATSREGRRTVWNAIARWNLHVAIRSLHFASGDENFDPVDPESDARALLSDIKESFEILIAEYTAGLRDTIFEEVVGHPVQKLAIEGVMGADDIGYSFIEQDTGASVIVHRSPASTPRRPRMYGHALRRVRYGPEAGRILGCSKFRDILLDVVGSRDLRGRKIWTEELVYGRIRHLQKEYGFPIDAADLRECLEVLEPHADEIVSGESFRKGQRFSIERLLRDIRWLIDREISSIKPWWHDLERLGSQSENFEQLCQETLDEYYRRCQLAYVEIVEESLPALKPYLTRFRSMPFSMQIEMVFSSGGGYARTWLQRRGFPVASFQDAGAVVTFPEAPSDWNSWEAIEAYTAETDQLRTRLRRASEGSYTFWESTILLPDFHGRDTAFGGLPDESTVVRGASDWLREDLEAIFKEIPTYGCSTLTSRPHYT